MLSWTLTGLKDAVRQCDMVVEQQVKLLNGFFFLYNQAPIHQCVEYSVDVLLALVSSTEVC